MEEHERARKVMINRDPAPTSPSKIKRSTLSAGKSCGFILTLSMFSGFRKAWYIAFYRNFANRYTYRDINSR